VRLREKIQKSAAAKQRKAKKQAKKNPEWRSKLKKDPGIPNLFPYKDKILAEIEEARRKKEEENARRRQLAKEQRLAGQAQGDAIEDSDDESEGGDMDDVESDQDDSMQVVSLFLSGSSTFAYIDAGRFKPYGSAGSLCAGPCSRIREEGSQRRCYG
jgi:nuclear GTP-binding protein